MAKSSLSSALILVIAAECYFGDSRMLELVADRKKDAGLARRSLEERVLSPGES